jgi:hypothetical protein
VIASEFSACCTVLNGALKINPFDAQCVTDAIDIALEMDTHLKKQRRDRDMELLSHSSSAQWTKQILNDLRLLRESAVTGIAKKRALAQMPQPANFAAIISAFQSARKVGICDRAKRVFIFDYGGTLLHKERFDLYIKHSLSAISGRKPSGGMMDAIFKLSQDPCNAVLVVTGLTKLKMGNIFADFHNVTLATSNGLVYLWGQNLVTAAERAEIFDRRAALPAPPRVQNNPVGNSLTAAATTATSANNNPDSNRLRTRSGGTENSGHSTGSLAQMALEGITHATQEHKGVPSAPGGWDSGSNPGSNNPQSELPSGIAQRTGTGTGTQADSGIDQGTAALAASDPRSKDPQGPPSPGAQAQQEAAGDIDVSINQRAKVSPLSLPIKPLYVCRHVSFSC